MIPKEIADDPGVEDIFQLGTEPEYKADPGKVARSATAIKVGALEQRKADVSAYDTMIANRPEPFWKRKPVLSC